jgi:hypothetical protein
VVRAGKDGGVSETETYVVFHLRGDFEPDEVSRRMGLVPDRTFAAGDVASVRTGRVHEWSGWSIDTHFMASDTIAEHLDWLLDRLEPAAGHLAELRAAGAEAELDCAWDSIGMGGGPWIPPEAMARLGALGLPLLISFYYGEPDDSD